MDYGSISWLAVVVAAVVFFALGGLWYAVLFSKTFTRASGMTEEEMGESNPVTFGVTFVLELLAAVGLSALIGGDSNVGDGLRTGLEVGVFFVFTTLAVTALYDRKSPVLFGLNAGYNLLGFAAMGAIIGAMQ